MCCLRKSGFFTELSSESLALRDFLLQFGVVNKQTNKQTKKEMKKNESDSMSYNFNGYFTEIDGSVSARDSYTFVDQKAAQVFVISAQDVDVNVRCQCKNQECKTY